MTRNLWPYRNTSDMSYLEMIKEYLDLSERLRDYTSNSISEMFGEFLTWPGRVEELKLAIKKRWGTIKPKNINCSSGI